MSKTQNPVTINNISTLVTTPEQYVTILLDGTLRSKIDKSVCKTLYQLAGDFLMEQRVKDSAYFYTDPSLDTIENQKEIQARMRDLQHILTNRAVAIFVRICRIIMISVHSLISNKIFMKYQSEIIGLFFKNQNGNSFFHLCSLQIFPRQLGNQCVKF